jgi:multiple sugar transport system ATP-binding protein
LARAIVRKPSVFLMDEPLSNLDAKLRVSMRAHLKNLHHTLGVTTIYVTHDQIEAMTLADRVVVMSQAEIQQIGTPAAIYNDPANLFVAGFIGSPPMNLVAGDVNDGVFSAPGVRIAGFGGLTQRGVVLGARAEDLTVVEGGQGGLTGQLKGSVFAFELTGDATLVTLQTEGNPAARITAKAGKDHRAQTGQTVGFNVNPANCFLFDANTQARIRVGL